MNKILFHTRYQQNQTKLKYKCFPHVSDVINDVIDDKTSKYRTFGKFHDVIAYNIPWSEAWGRIWVVTHVFYFTEPKEYFDQVWAS